MAKDIMTPWDLISIGTRCHLNPIMAINKLSGDHVPRAPTSSSHYIPIYFRRVVSDKVKVVDEISLGH